MSSMEPGSRGNSTEYGSWDCPPGKDRGKIRNDVRGLFLGFPLDQLLNEACPYLVPTREQSFPERQGILLPTKDNPGTGNIVICGPPGSGKSTLALQFAVACASREENRSISAYISLESNPCEVKSKAEPFGWGDYLREIRHLHQLNEMSTPSDLADTLSRVLTQDTKKCLFHRGHVSDDDCDAHGRRSGGDRGSVLALEPWVLLVSLSPRPLTKSEVEEDIFWTRYAQLEKLLAAGHELRKRGGNDGQDLRSILPLVVVDSLNMLALRSLEREELFRLFSLLKRYQTVGVFVVEATKETPFDSTLADVVISLTMAEDNGYLLRYFEVTKSRYRNQVCGRHPFKTLSLREGCPPTPRIPGKHASEEKGDPPRHGVVVFPSLHYVVLKTGETPGPDPECQPRRWEDPGALWGISAFRDVLPANLNEGSVITIEGPRGAFKTNLAMTFLAEGLRRDETVLLVRFHDWPLLPRRLQPGGWPAVSVEVANDEATGRPGSNLEQKKFYWDELEPIDEQTGQRWKGLAKPEKAQVSVWQKRGSQACLFEVDFKGGAILPEELIQIVWDIIIRRQENGKRILRVVVDDVSEIGSAYPFLRKSSTSGDIFLAAFAHVMRNHRIDLVVTGTTGELPEANEQVGRICAVADTVISCRFCDVFGKRHVILQGEGLIARADSPHDTAGGSVPPLIQNVSKSEDGKGTIRRMFWVNPNYLEGLVGFDTGHVHRPGVSLHVFEENELICGKYNRDLELMLRAAFASERAEDRSAARQRRYEARHGLGSLADIVQHSRSGSVSLIPFGSDDSEAMHDSLQVFRRGEPIDRTVLCTVDEFWDTAVGFKGKPAERFVPFNTQGILEGPDGEGRRHGLMVKHPNRLFVNPDDMNQAYVWPYYMNVLLLAYRRDKLRDQMLNPQDWPAVLRATEAAELDEKAGRCSVRRRFWLDLSASETLSCALLDALVVARRQDSGINENTVQHLFDPPDEHADEQRLSENALTQVMSLYSVFQLTKYNELSKRDRIKYKGVLPNDAAVYLCWYSQLRDLIARKPELADKLNVSSLPGGGFTGDWFIGIVGGSVSPALGKTIIEKLCRRDEEYKRFARGVGLPVHESFRKGEFFAWYRGLDVPVATVLDIHKGANSRADIPCYGQIRSTLSTIAGQLTPLAGLAFDKDLAEPAVGEIVGRVFKQVRMLQQRR